MKTVMVFGTFDILHLGHISLFQQAKKYGEKLIVVVAQDARVKELKKRAPIHTAKERKALLDHIDLIDKVILGSKTDVYNVVKKYKPDVIALGYDQVWFVDTLEEKIQEFGLQTKIVRLRAFKEYKYKGSKIRSH